MRLHLIMILFLTSLHVWSQEQPINNFSTELTSIEGAYLFQLDGQNKKLEIDSSNSSYKEYDLNNQLTGEGQVSSSDANYYFTPVNFNHTSVIQQPLRITFIETNGNLSIIEARELNSRNGRIIHIQKQP